MIARAAPARQGVHCAGCRPSSGRRRSAVARTTRRPASLSSGSADAGGAARGRVATAGRRAERAPLPGFSPTRLAGRNRAVPLPSHRQGGLGVRPRRRRSTRTVQGPDRGRARAEGVPEGASGGRAYRQARPFHPGSQARRQGGNLWMGVLDRGLRRVRIRPLPRGGGQIRHRRSRGGPASRRRRAVARA